MAKELDLHLLKLARTKRKIPWRDFVAKALSDLGDTQRQPVAGTVEHIFEVYENTLSRFRAKERGAFFSGQRPNVSLEHQVEFARFGQRADLFGFGTNDLREVIDLGQAHHVAVIDKIVDVLVAEVEVFERVFLNQFDFIIACGRGDEGFSAFGFYPATVQLIVTVSFFGFLTIDHVVVEKVVVSRALPNLGVHDDRAIEPFHREGRRGAWQRRHVVVAIDHFTPPRFFDVTFEFDSQWAVVPKTLQAAVDYAGLKKKSTLFAKGNDFFHAHKKRLESEDRGEVKTRILVGRLPVEQTSLSALWFATIDGVSRKTMTRNQISHHRTIRDRSASAMG